MGSGDDRRDGPEPVDGGGPRRPRPVRGEAKPSAGPKPPPAASASPSEAPESPEPPESSSESPEPAGGPVPVRDLMKTMTPEPEAAGEPRWEGEERGFERDGVEWVVRSAGAGSYGTGDLGPARLVAIHFYRVDDPDRPVREALVSAGVFPHLHARELRELYERATPIELDE